MRALVEAIPDGFVHALAAEPQPIDVAREACGARVVALPANEATPDGVFVEIRDRARIRTCAGARS